MPISPDAARWLIEKGHDATHASDVGLDRAPDLEVLEAARIQDRIVVTADLDYAPVAFTRAEAPGLILFRGGNYADAEIIDGLSRVFASIGSYTALALHRRSRKDSHSAPTDPNPVIL